MAGPIKPIDGGEEIPEFLPLDKPTNPEKSEGVEEIGVDILFPANPKNTIEKFKDDPDGYIKHLEINAGEINKCLKSLKNLKPEDLADVGKREVLAAKKFDQLIDEIMQLPGGSIEMAYIWVAFPMDNIIKEFVDVGGVGKNTIKAIFVAELIFRAFDRIGKGAGLIYKRESLNNLKVRVEVWEKNKQLDAAEKSRLEELKNFIKAEEKKLRNEGFKYILESTICIPTELKTIFVMMGKYSGTTAYATGWGFFIAGTIAGGYYTHKAYMDVKTYEEFVKLVKEEPIVTKGMWIDQESGKIRITLSARKKLKKGVQKLIDKRKAYTEERVKKQENSFKELIEAELEKPDKDFTALKQNLIERGGIDLDRLNITVLGELDYVISEKSTDYQNLLRQYTDFKETARITQARLALKTLAKKKIENVKKFYNYNLAKASTVLTFSTIIFAVTLILKTLELTGLITLGALASSFTGIGFVALGAVLLIVGLYVLYRYKPNLFKTFLRGVQLHLALVSIPAFIQQFRQTVKDKKTLEEILRVQDLSLKLVELRSSENRGKTEDVKTKILLKQLGVKVSEEGKYDADYALQKLENRIKEVFKKRQKLDSELKSLNKKVKGWNAKIEPLQEELKNAKSKDFQRAANLVKEKIDFHEVIADALMAGGGDLDKETKEVLEKNLGIDWEKIPKEKEKIMNYLKTFFAFDEAETRVFFDERLQKEKGV